MNIQDMNETNITLEAVQDHLRGQRALFGTDEEIKEFSLIPDVPVTSFFTESDVQAYKDACAWWPQVGQPGHMVKPTLYELCAMYYEEAKGATFRERLLNRAAELQAWMAKNPATAGDSPALQADADSASATSAKAVKAASAQAYADYLQVCKDRRAAITEWDAKVADAYSKFVAIKTAPAS